MFFQISILTMAVYKVIEKLPDFICNLIVRLFIDQNYLILDILSIHRFLNLFTF